MFSFQLATISHLPALRTFSERLFIQTYAPLNTPENMKLYCAEAFSEENFAKEFHQENIRYWLAMYEDVLAGYTKLILDSPSPGGSLSGVEMARFYIDTPFQGQGLARQLMHHCHKWMQQEGFQEVWLGVWPQNPRAVRFYQKEGFVKIGTADFMLGQDRQTDDLMRKIL